MRTIKLFAAALVAASAVPAVAGATSMDVGHGIRLGSVFDPGKATSVQESQFNKDDLYQVADAATYREHDVGKVFVALTPDENRVYEIWAIRQFERGGPCKDLRDEVFDSLRAAYPDATTNRNPMSMDGRRSVTKGETKISTGCKTGIGKATFYLRHRHTALHQQVAGR